MWQLRWLFLPVGLLLNEWGSCKTQYSLLKLVIAFERLLCFFCSSVVFELSCAQLERHDVTLSCAPIRFLVKPIGCSAMLLGPCQSNLISPPLHSPDAH